MTDHVVYNDRNFRVVQLNNHTYYVNPIIHLNYDGSMLILDISGQPETSFPPPLPVPHPHPHPQPHPQPHPNPTPYPHPYPWYEDSSGVHVYPHTDMTTMDLSGAYFHPYHDVSGWHIVPHGTKDIGWHIHPIDASTNIAYDASGWHFIPHDLSGHPLVWKVNMTTGPTPFSSPSEPPLDASLNWWYLHHGHPHDLSGVHVRTVYFYDIIPCTIPVTTWDEEMVDFIPDVTVPRLDFSMLDVSCTPVPALYLQIDLCPSTADTSANVSVNGPYDVSGGGVLYDISGNYPTTDMAKPFPYVIYICDQCSRVSMVRTPTPAPSPTLVPIA